MMAVGGNADARAALEAGRAAHEHGLHHDALRLFTVAVEAGERSGDQETTVRAQDALGELHTALGNHVGALDHHLRALALYDDLEDSRGRASALHSIGVLYGLCGEFDSAHEYLKSSLEAFQEIGDHYLVLRSLANLGAVYGARNQLQQALDCALRALTVYQEVGSRSDIGAAQLSVAAVYAQMGNHDVALYVRTQAMENLNDEPLGVLRVRAMADLGESYQVTGDDEGARFVLEQGLAIAGDLDDRALLSRIHEGLSDVLERLGDLRGALDHHRRYVALAAEHTGREKQKAIAELRMRFELERNLKDEEIRRRNDVMLAVVAAQEAEQRRIAGDLHDGVGQLLAAAKVNLLGMEDVMDTLDAPHRRAFAQSLAALDRACVDIRRIAHSLASVTLEELGLEAALREMITGVSGAVGTQFSFMTHGASGRLPHHAELVLYRVAQELVANILKHAQASRASLQLLRRGGTVVLMVEDDGVGYDTRTATSGGMGLGSIETRVRTLNGHVEFSSQPGHGTSVTVEVPLIEAAEDP